MIFTRAGLGELGIATPHWPRDHFCTVLGQLAGNFWKKSVVADHHADFSKYSVENRIVFAWCDPLRSFAGR